ncbi:hypothetical protein AB0O42_35530 [Streptomyces sp. NPDC089922]|uniref:hypothetical protein n=1 Tax=Streptomyces sp. NPDC089922 TaxID=3155189 RepID=UPI00341600C8
MRSISYRSVCRLLGVVANEDQAAALEAARLAAQDALLAAQESAARLAAQLAQQAGGQ